MSILYKPDEVIAEMLRKLADGEEVNSGAYLHVMQEHADTLAQRLREMRDTEDNEDVSDIFGRLAEGSIISLGEFGDDGDSATEADLAAARLREVAEEMWPGSTNAPVTDNTPETGMQPV